MTDPVCDDVLRRLELGEGDGLAGHLATCERCRAEAAEVRRLAACLSAEAEIPPPRDLDARLRSMLAAEPSGLLLRPWLAGGVAVAAFAALVATLAVVLSSTPVAEYGPLMAVALGLAYLTLCAAAALPLLLHVMNKPTPATEVQA